MFSWFFQDFLWFFYDLNVRTRSQPTPNLLCFFLMYWRFFVDFLLIFWVARGEAPKRGGEAMPRSQVKQFPFCFGFLIFSTTFHYSRFALRASRSCYYRFQNIASRCSHKHIFGNLGGGWREAPLKAGDVAAGFGCLEVSYSSREGGLGETMARERAG